jgi:hypothetical protein
MPSSESSITSAWHPKNFYNAKCAVSIFIL